MLTTFLGPALPLFQSRFGLTDAELGSLFAAQFTGATLVTIGAGAALARFGVAVTLGVGFTAIAVALLVLQSSTFGIARAALFLLGGGLGLSIPTTNMWMAAQVTGRAKASVLNSINLAWGLGAALCPLMLRAAQSAGGLPGFLLASAVCSSAMAVAALGILPRGRLSGTPGEAIRGIVTTALPFAALVFLYVGVETAVGGWAAIRAKRDAGAAWLAAPVLFWGGLLGGRALASMVSHRFEERRVLRTGAFVATAAIAAWVVTPGAGTFVLVLIIGLGLAPLFPTAVALFESRVGTAGTTASGPLFALGGIGGAVLPWLVGVASARFGGLEAGLLVVLAASAAVLALTMRGLD